MIRNEQELTNTCFVHFLIKRAINSVVHVSKTSTIFSFAVSVTVDISDTKSKACFSYRTLGGRSQSYGTKQRTAFSLSTWTRLQEVLEVCGFSKLQSTDRSLLLSITVTKTLCVT